MLKVKCDYNIYNVEVLSLIYCPRWGRFLEHSQSPSDVDDWPSPMIQQLWCPVRESDVSGVILPGGLQY